MAARNIKYLATSSDSAAVIPESKFKKKRLAQAISATLITGVSSVAWSADNTVLEEVVVTATKRTESVMDVPLAITAISGDTIRDVNLDDVKDLIAFTPGVTGNTKDSFMDFISIRGIRTIDYGNGGDPSISIFKNGLYQGRTGSAVTSLFDVERAEVLRGPQGFLYGRNAVSGAMNIITARPNMEENEGYIEVDIGERDHAVVEGAASFVVSDNFAVRISAYHSEEDGYVEDLGGGPDLIEHEKDAFRISGRWESDNLVVNAFAEYEERDQSGTVYRATGNGLAFTDVHPLFNNGAQYAVPSDERDINVDSTLPSYDGGEVKTFGLEIAYDLDWATLTSITGYKDHEYSYLEDYDATPTVLFNYGQDQEGDYFEQELRLTSNSDGPLSWYAGVSYYEEDIDTIFLGQQSEEAYCLTYWSYYSGASSCQEMFDHYNTYYGGYYAYVLDSYFGTYNWTSTPDGLINDRNRTKGKYSGYSAYVNLGYEFNEHWGVSIGIRYNDDEKEFSQEALPDPQGSVLTNKVQTGFQTPAGPLKDTQDWNETTYQFVVNWHPNDSSLVYASVTSGYKPGGFGSFNISNQGTGGNWGREIALPGTHRPDSYGPETVTSYDLGYKGTLFDGRLQLSANAFVYDYEDLQAIYTEGLIVIVDNIGQVDGEGVEVDINAALTDNINLRLGYSYFDSEADDVQAFCAEGAAMTGDINVCEGNSIPWAPEHTAYALLNAQIPIGNGEAFGQIAWTWEDDTRIGFQDLPATQEIDGINQTDIVIGYRTDQWQVSAYVENVFDEVWYDSAYESENGVLARTFPGLDASPYVEHTFGPSRPRTIGVRFSYRY